MKDASDSEVEYLNKAMSEEEYLDVDTETDFEIVRYFYDKMEN